MNCNTDVMWSMFQKWFISLFITLEYRWFLLLSVMKTLVQIFWSFKEKMNRIQWKKGWKTKCVSCDGNMSHFLYTMSKCMTMLLLPDTFFASWKTTWQYYFKWHFSLLPVIVFLLPLLLPLFSFFLLPLCSSSWYISSWKRASHVCTCDRWWMCSPSISVWNLACLHCLTLSLQRFRLVI